MPGASAAALAAPDQADIAIVGLSARLPGADDIDGLRARLLAGTVGDNGGAVRRWGDTGNGSGRWGVFLDGVDGFDPGFFGLSAPEAEAMDPQERLFLMSAWHALEDAGYPGRRAAGVTGMYVGVTAPTYNLVGFDPQRQGAQQAANLSFASIANRVSHFLNLTGPSLSIDTMCSSSLVAVHMACDSIRRGECTMALAGGVNLYLHPARLDLMRRANMLATDGTTRAIGAGGAGFVAGEAVACVVLKPLDQARADGDRIHAVIKGSAVGHTGTTLGYMAPKSQAQADLVGKALQNARVQPDQVDYVEMQWSGSDLADTMELEGLRLGYRTEGRAVPLRVGTVKPNVGHAEAASGMAQLVKAVLQLQDGAFLKTALADAGAVQAELGRKNIRLQLDNEAWPAPAARPRLAGIGSHGAGGTGVHLVLAAHEAQPAPAARAPDAGTPCLVVLSARSRPALMAAVAAQAQCLAARLAAEGADGGVAPLRLADLAHTLQTGRVEFPHRWAALASSTQALLAQLQATVADGSAAQVVLSPADGAARPGARRHAPGVAQALAAGGHLHALAELWVSGMAVDWGALALQGRDVRRIGLPGYVFEQKRHWAGGLAVETTTALPVAVAAIPAIATPAAGVHELVDMAQAGLVRLGFAAAARVYEFLRDAGVLVEGAPTPLSAVTARLSSSADKEGVALRLLELLEREGLIAVADDGSVTVVPGSAKRLGDVKSSRDMFLRAAPEYVPCFELLDACLHDLFAPGPAQRGAMDAAADALVAILAGAGGRDPHRRTDRPGAVRAVLRAPGGQRRRRAARARNRRRHAGICGGRRAPERRRPRAGGLPAGVRRRRPERTTGRRRPRKLPRHRVFGAGHRRRGGLCARAPPSTSS